MGELLRTVDAFDTTGIVGTGLDSQALQLAVTGRTLVHEAPSYDAGRVRSPNMLHDMPHTDEKVGVPPSTYAQNLGAMTAVQITAWLAEPVQGETTTPNMLIGGPDGTQSRN